MRSAFRRVAVIVAAAGALVLLGAGTLGGIGFVPAAQAHNYLVSSTPEAGAVLSTLPKEFSVTTNDVLLDFGGENTGSAGALEVKGPDGLYYGDGCVVVSGASISTGAALGPAGVYTVIWRVVSTDGHPVSSQYEFTWQPDAGQTVSAGSSAAPVCATATDAVSGDGSADASDADGSASGAAAQAESDREFFSVLAWGGGALLAVALAVGATLFVLRRPRVGTAAAPGAPDASGREAGSPQQN